MKKKLAVSLLLLLSAAAAWSAIPRPPLHEGLSFSKAVFDRKGRLLRMTAAADGKFRVWVPLREISPLMIRATILQEDKNFRSHPGFDPGALVRAPR